LRNYEFMRIVLMFDLPVVTKTQKRIYTKFRKLLLKKGYLMLQYSVYVKLFANRDSATRHIKVIKSSVPQAGQIRLMLLTEKQYANMEIIIGGKSRQEEIVTIDPLIIL